MQEFKYIVGDISQLEHFIKLLKENEWVGKTKNIAIGVLINTLEEKLKDIQKPIY